MVSFKKIKSFALISVFDKSNLGFLCDLLKKNKIGIISTGSTSKKIKSLGYNCFEISDLTKFNEVLDGRVKTLHPKIYISILHNRKDNGHKKTLYCDNTERKCHVCFGTLFLLVTPPSLENHGTFFRYFHSTKFFYEH